MIYENLSFNEFIVLMTKHYKFLGKYNEILKPNMLKKH